MSQRVSLDRRNVLVGFGGILGASGAGLPVLGRTVSPRLPAKSAWSVFYGANADLAAFDGFDVVVLDPQFQGSVPTLSRMGIKTLGYVSLGEFAKTSGYFDKLSSGDALLYESEAWPGTFIADVRHPAWCELILKVIIPSIRAKGFTGLFFDTLDTPPYLEAVDPVKYAGMRKAAIDLVKSIRRSFPEMPLLMNRGYALIPDLRTTVDAVMAESLLSTFDNATKGYRRLEGPLVQQQLDLLKAAKADGVNLPIYALNYWDPSDTVGVKKLYTEARALGFTPYVATILLDRIYREPKD